MAATAWNTDTEALLTRLWTEEGRTFAEIAEAVTKAGHAVTRSAVSGRIRKLGLVGKQRRDEAEAAAATRPEKPGVLSTEAEIPAAAPATLISAATIVRPEINTPAPGAWPIATLREGQCRFACTGHNVPPADHRFCGQPTQVGPGNLHGSWCPEHLERMYDRSSRLARPSFLKRAGDHR